MCYIHYSHAQIDVVTFQFRAAYRNDVEYPCHTIRIIFGIGIRNDFYLPDGRSGDSLHQLRGLVAHHGVWLSVHIYLKISTALYFHDIIPLYRNHRHLPQHFQQRHAPAVGIIGCMIGYPIELCLYQRT